MTIPEAVRLVIQAGAMGNGGETFVLDMGDPRANRRPGARDDQAVRARPRPRHRDHLHRQSRRREARREAFQRRRAGRWYDPSKIAWPSAGRCPEPCSDRSSPVSARPSTSTTSRRRSTCARGRAASPRRPAKPRRRTRPQPAGAATTPGDGGNGEAAPPSPATARHPRRPPGVTQVGPRCPA